MPILKIEETGVKNTVKEELSGIPETKITSASSMMVITEEQLIEAVDNPEISEINRAANIINICNTLNINREISFVGGSTPVADPIMVFAYRGNDSLNNRSTKICRNNYQWKS